MHQRLTTDHCMVVKRETVRVIMKYLDPEGVFSRPRRVFRRRQYSFQGPNYMWHLDGYDKLKPFGFAIHGAINGYSRRILWLKVGQTNNDPRVVISYYLSCIRQIGTDTPREDIEITEEMYCSIHSETSFQEFEELAELLMEDEILSYPSTADETLVVYRKLVTCFENAL